MDIRITAQRDISIGEFVGRDKIVNNIQNIYQRALTAAEEADTAKSVEAKILAEGVSAFLQRLQARADDVDSKRGRPYKGLLEYTLGDAPIFFGRAQAIEDMAGLMERGALTILHGEPGSGKSSLLQAGLSSLMISGGHLPVTLRPYNTEPSLVIKRAFLSDLSQTPLLATAPLREFLRQVGSVLGRETRLYIFLDQFEEFFTHVPEPGRADFVSELAECLDDASLNVRWVVSLRTEYFGHLSTFRPRIRNPYENDYALYQFTRDEAKEVVGGPAARRKIRYDPGLIDACLDDLGKDAISPPEIQLVCSALFEMVKEGEDVIPAAAYETVGRAAGILGGHLDTVLKRDLLPGQRPVAQQLLEHLISSDNHRMLRTRAELITALAEHSMAAEVVDATLNQLVDSRLLRVHETTKEGETAVNELAYELAQRFLLNRITLDPAVRARKAAQELLDNETLDFKKHGTLLSDDKLAIIAPRKAELTFTPDAQALMSQSERALKRQRQFVIGGVSLLGILVLISLITLVAAFSAEGRRSQAVGTQQAAETAAVDSLSQQQLSEARAAQAATREAQSQAALATSAAEIEFASTREAQAVNAQATSAAAAAFAATREANVRAVVGNLFIKNGLVPVGGQPAAFVVVGEYVWVANEGDNTVQAMHVESGALKTFVSNTGALNTALNVGARPRALAYDGERVWVANSDDGTVQAIDPDTGALGGPLVVGVDPAALFVANARLWVANQGDDTVQMIDLATLTVNAPIAVGAAPLALTFDGVRVWVACFGGDVVQAIDSQTRQVTAEINVGVRPLALAFDGVRVWVAVQGDNIVQAILPATNTITATVAVGRRPGALAFDGVRLWVANQGDNTVEVIDPDTGATAAALDVGSFPRALAFAGGWLWTANFGDNTVLAIDPEAGDVARPIAVGPQPRGLLVVGGQIWVTSQLSNTVQAINTGNRQLGASITVGGDPRTLAFDGSKLWIANARDNTLQPIAPATGIVGPPVSVGDSPRALLFAADRLWVANFRGNNVQALDPARGSVLAEIPVGNAPVALLFDGTRVWVANSADNTVQAIDPATNVAGPPIGVGVLPFALAFDGTRVWVANQNDNSIQAIDPTTGVAQPALLVGAAPVALAYDGAYLWVANFAENTVQSLDPTTGEIYTPLPVGAGPIALAFDGQKLWVASRDDATVQYVLLHK